MANPTNPRKAPRAHREDFTGEPDFAEAADLRSIKLRTEMQEDADQLRGADLEKGKRRIAGRIEDRRVAKTRKAKSEPASQEEAVRRAIEEESK